MCRIPRRLTRLYHLQEEFIDVRRGMQDWLEEAIEALPYPGSSKVSLERNVYATEEG
jgi:hypothetical protein